MDIRYILKVFIIAFLILSLIVFVNSLGLNLNGEPKQKKLLQVVTVETTIPTPIIESLDNLSTSTPISTSKSQAFCDVYKGSSGSLDKSCNRLTKDNCNETSCCIWSSNNKCAAGTVDGPTFSTNTNSKNKKLDYYLFQGKCYGSNCPEVS